MSALTYGDIADLSRWHETLLWGGIVIPHVARAPIFISLLQAVQMDGAALEVIERHNEFVLRQKVLP